MHSSIEPYMKHEYEQYLLEVQAYSVDGETVTYLLISSDDYIPSINWILLSVQTSIIKQYLASRLDRPILKRTTLLEQRCIAIELKN